MRPGGGRSVKSGKKAAKDADLPPSERMKTAALRLLSRRAHTRSELRRKLRLRDFAGGEIESLLDRFTELGYLDDAAAARAWARGRLEGRPMGRRLLEEELRGRGLSPSILRAVLEELYGEGEERRLAVAAARKRARSLGKDDPQRARQRLLRHLLGRGFPMGICIQAADDALNTAPSEEADAQEGGWSE